MLRTIVFICGAALMALELVAARVLGARARQLDLRVGKRHLRRHACAQPRLLGRRPTRRPGERGTRARAAHRRSRLADRAGAGDRGGGAPVGGRARPARRLAGRFGRHLLPAGASARDRVAAGRAPRRFRRARPHRPLGRLALRDLDGRKHRRHARDGVLAHSGAVALTADRRDRLHAVRLLARRARTTPARTGRVGDRRRSDATPRTGISTGRGGAGDRRGGDSRGRLGACACGACLGDQRERRARAVPRRHAVPPDHRHRGRQRPPPALRRHQPVRDRPARTATGQPSPTPTTSTSRSPSSPTRNASWSWAWAAARSPSAGGATTRT